VLVEILLNEGRTEMHVDLHQRFVTDAFEAVHLASLDDENVSGAGLEFFSIDIPDPATFPHELNFVVRMAVWSRPPTGQSVQQEYRDRNIAVVGPDEMVRAPFERQVCLARAMHSACTRV
jgi:hypothetical protein